MLKKFTDGLIFGSGFAVALIIILSLGIIFVLPKALDTLSPAHPKAPEFKNPKPAEAFIPEPSANKDFSFFKPDGERMKIPSFGGILSMSVMQSPPDAKRPSTYQLWLTETSLWQIRTIEDKVEIEALDRPQDANADILDKLMSEKMGSSGRQGGTTTISSSEIQLLKSGSGASRDSTLNGKLTLSKEGVVFVYPNNY